MSPGAGAPRAGAGRREDDVGFALEIPAESEFLATVRMFVSALGHRLDLHEEQIEDLKVGASEACAAAIRARDRGAAGGPVLLRAGGGAGSGVWFEVDSTDLPADTDFSLSPSDVDDLVADPAVEPKLAIQLIRSLFEDVTTTAGSTGGTRVRFAVPPSTS